MILDTTDPRTLGALTGATLNEDAHGISTMELTWAGFCPAWVRYMEPVTLIHRGRVLFHGKVTAHENSNDGGELSGKATVSNILWMLDHSTLASQLAGIMGGSGDDGAYGHGRDELAAAAAMTAARLVQQVRLETQDWTRAGGAVEISAEASEGVRQRGLLSNSSQRILSTFTAMLNVMDNQPDVFLLVDYDTATVHMMTVAEAPLLTLDTARVRVLAASGITAQYESCCNGIVLLVSRTDDPLQRTSAYAWPPGINVADVGVRCYNVQVTGGDVAADFQTNHYVGLAQQYYEAGSGLQWGGTVTLSAADVEVSPLGRRVSLVGEGTHEDWHTMQAIVTSCTWDLLEGTVACNLGHEWTDPSFGEPGEAEEPEEGETTTTGLSTGPVVTVTQDPGGGGGGGDDPGGGSVDGETMTTDGSWDDTWPTDVGSPGSGETPTQSPSPTQGASPTGGSSPTQSPCAQCPRLEQFQAIIQQVLAANKATLGGEGESEAQTNANGTITVKTTWSY